MQINKNIAVGAGLLVIGIVGFVLMLLPDIFKLIAFGRYMGWW